MSSTYRAICLNHDPAIEIYDDNGYDGLTWTDRDIAVAAVASRQGALAAHPNCDLLIGRYSSPLVALICPPNCGPDSMGTKDRLGRACWHNNANEIDRDWLRLMVAAIAEPNPKTAAAVESFSGLCWKPGRVYKLRHLLNPE